MNEDVLFSSVAHFVESVPQIPEYQEVGNLIATIQCTFLSQSVLDIHRARDAAHSLYLIAMKYGFVVAADVFYRYYECLCRALLLCQ